MQKLIGSILVLTATAGAGYLYGEGLKDYLRQMEYLRYIAGMIRDFGAFLGQGDRETMGRSIELSMKQMDLMIRQQRGELAGKRKIGNCLGVMSGLFLIILLW